MRGVYRGLGVSLNVAIARCPQCRVRMMRCPRLHMCAAAFLLLLLSGPWGAAGAATSTPRDPFALPAQAHCELQPAEKLAWQLQGVIGQPGDFHAWLVAAPATRLRLRAGEPLPGTRWQVVDIARLSVTLGADNGCPPPLRLALKERKHGQTTDPTAAAGIGPGAQLPGAG